MTTHARTFIAIPVDPAPVRAVGKLIDDLSKRVAGYRWVVPENFHLTLSFLGDVPTTQIPEMCSLLQDAVGGHAPFELEFQGAGAFPDLRRPKTVWVGCGAGSEQAKSLQNAVAQALDLFGYPPEGRPYSPHLTIGRLKRNARTSPAAGEALAGLADARFGATYVRQIHAMASKLRPSGPEYAVMATLPLS